MVWFRTWALVFAALLCTELAADGAEPAETVAACARPELTQAARLACTVGVSLEPTKVATLVVSSAANGSSALRDPSGLGTLLAKLVAGKVHGTYHEGTASLGMARRLAAKHQRLIFLEPKVEGGQLALSADAYPSGQGFWARLRTPTPAPTGHAFGRAPLDAELQRYFERPSLHADAVHKAKSSVTHPIAAACADANGDGIPEIVLADRARVVLGRLVGEAFQAEAEASWRDLTGVAPAPLREPIATLTIEAPHRLVAGSTDRADSVVLDGSLHVLTRHAGNLPWPGADCTARGERALLPTSLPCSATRKDMPGAPSPTPSADVDAIAGFRFGQGSGVGWVQAARNAGTRVLVIRDSAGRVVELPNVGAQIAVGDLDRDGAPEVVVSRPTLRAEDDAVSVHTWHANGTLDHRYTLPVPGGARALAVCEPVSAGRAPLVIATRNEVWLVE